MKMNSASADCAGPVMVCPCGRRGFGRNRIVTGHGVAPSYAEVAISRTGYLVAGRPRCKEEARAAYWELRKRADDAADGVPCDVIH